MFGLTSSPSFTTNGKTAKYCGSFSTVSNASAYMTSQKLKLNNNDPISIFCWVYMNSYSTTGAELNGIVSNHWHESAGIGLTLRNNGSNFQVSFSAPAGTTLSGRVYSQYHGATTFTTGSWHHIGVVYSGTDIKLYLDGQAQTIMYNGATLQGLKYFTYTATSGSENPIGLACWSTTYSGYGSECKLQDVRVYDHALSDLEVKNLARGLCLHYNFEDLYEPVEYIQSTGTQYIDTGIVPSGSSLRVVLDYKFNMSNGDQTLFGTYSEAVMSLNAMVSSNKTWQFGSNGWKNLANQSTCDTNRHVVDCYWGNGSQYFKADGTTLYSGSSGQFTDTFSLRLFNHYDRYYSHANVYSCEIYYGENLVRDYIPVIRKTDGNVGLYDKVTCTFYGNTGTGTFGYGTNRINQFQNYMLNQFTTGSTNQIYNTVTDTRTYFDFQIQTFNGGTYITNVLNAGSLTVGNRYNFVVNNTSMSSSTTDLRLKHNGSTKDVTIAYVPVDYTKSYVVSFTVLSANPTTTGNSGIRLENLKVMEIPKIEDKSGYGVNATLRGPSAFSTTNDARVGTTSLRNVSGDSNARINTSLNPSFIDNGTICFWYKKDSSAFSINSGHFLVATQNSSGYYFGATADGLPFNNGCSYSTFYLDGVSASSSNIQDTNWHFYAFTGVSLTSWTSFSMQAHGDTSWLWRGNIADFKIYNTSLSASDIKDLYETRAKIDNKGNIYCEKLIDSQDVCEFVDNQGITKSSSFSYSSEAKISSGYKELDCISFDGNQYINTNVAFTDSNNLPIIIEADITPTDSTGVNHCLAGCGNAQWNGPVMLNLCNNKMEFGTGGYDVLGDYTPNERVTFRAVINASKQQYTKIVSASTAYYNKTKTFPTSSYPLYIGNFNAAGSVNAAGVGYKGKLYKFTVTYGKTTRIFIPAKRKSDGAIGLLDKVENKFYTNSGSGYLGYSSNAKEFTMISANNIYEDMGASGKPSLLSEKGKWHTVWEGNQSVSVASSGSATSLSFSGIKKSALHTRITFFVSISTYWEDYINNTYGDDYRDFTIYEKNLNCGVGMNSASYYGAWEKQGYSYTPSYPRYVCFYDVGDNVLYAKGQLGSYSWSDNDAYEHSSLSVYMRKIEQYY